MLVNSISGSMNFKGGASVYLYGYSDGYKNGVDNKPNDNFSANRYDTTWERTLYKAAYDKGYNQGESEQGKSIYDLKYRSIYDGSRDNYCPNVIMCSSGELAKDCSVCADIGNNNCNCATVNLDEIPIKAKLISLCERLYISQAQDYLAITNNDSE